MAEDYYSFVDSKPWNADYERPAMLELIGSVKNETILDAGCATGWYSNYFLEKDAKKVIGIDINEKMLDFARKRLGNKSFSHRSSFIKASLEEKLKFLDDDTFHKVVSSLTMHYLKNWKLTLDEFSRVLIPKGKLYISTHHPIMDYELFPREDYFHIVLSKDSWNMNGKKIDIEFYSRNFQEIINPIIEAGFKIDKIVEPKSTLRFKEKDQVNYKKLMKRPNFVLIEASKI